MARQINPKWADSMREKIKTGVLDVTTPSHLAAKWLTYELVQSGLSFKSHNMGSGIKRFTTDTDQCPCCKRKY